MSLHPDISLRHGWLVLYKPVGITSAAAVGRVKRCLKVKKIGHAGTLDPLACGILPLAIGEATKTVGYAMLSEKSYRFTVTWGAATDTDDAEGQVVATSDIRPDREAIFALLPRFTGDIIQIPPVYSALKIKGKRACDRVRQGEEICLPPRHVQVYEWVVEEVAADHARFHVRCGKGTYVRSLARDMAEALGTKGHVTYLERTAVGPFDVARAILLEKLEETGYNATSSVELLPVQAVLDDIPVLPCTTEEAQKLRHGVAIPVPAERAQGTAVAMYEGAVVAIGEVGEGGYFRPSRVFNL